MEKQVSKQNKFNVSKKLMLTSIIVGSVALLFALLSLLAVIFDWKIDDDKLLTNSGDFHFFTLFSLFTLGLAIVFVIILLVSTIFMPKDCMIKKKLTGKTTKIINFSSLGLVLVGLIVFLVGLMVDNEDLGEIALIVAGAIATLSYVWTILIYSFTKKTKQKA